MATNTKEDKNKSGRGFFGRIGRSVRDMRGEMKKVVWPSKKQVFNNTGIVLAFMLLSAVVIGGFDAIMSLLLGLFFGTSA